MPAKDAWGTAFCCGTSSVIRMTALMKAGGFPTESVTEDYLLTLRLKRHGFRTVYLNERLSLGLAPEGLKEYITQRSRWCLGFIQIIRGNDGPFKIGNNLAFLDRVSLIESLLYWAGAHLFRVAGLLVPILYLVFGINAVDVDTREGMSYFLPSNLAQISVMAWLSGQRVLPVLTDLSQMLAAREILTAVLRCVSLQRPLVLRGAQGTCPHLWLATDSGKLGWCAGRVTNSAIKRRPDGGAGRVTAVHSGNIAS